MEEVAGLNRITRILVKDVSVVYSTPGRKVYALKRFTQEFTPGITLLMGPNGSGKTTLLNTIAGVIKPLEGNVMLNNSISLYKLSEKELSIYRIKYVSYMLQEDIFIEELSVLDNIALPYIIFGLKPPLDEINTLTKRFNIHNLLHEKPSSLSGGEKRKVSLVRALTKKADIYLLDEPTSSLDRTSVIELGKILNTLKEAGKIVIIATHDPDLEKYADKIIRMRPI